MTREHDEDDNKCPDCGNDRMDGHKMTCEASAPDWTLSDDLDLAISDLENAEQNFVDALHHVDDTRLALAKAKKRRDDIKREIATYGNLPH